MIGAGVLKGMALTFREFLGTYPAFRWVLERVGVTTNSGIVTSEYPEKKLEHPERFRYFPFLVYDGTPENLRCVSCKICEQECPPQCIHILGPAKDAQGRPLKVNGRTIPEKFDIDMSICMSCRICVDVCPFDAIEMDNQYEFAVTDRFGPLVFDKNQLLRSNEYFQKIKPIEAATVDQRLAAKAKKAAPAASAAAPAAGQPSQPATTSQ